MPSSCLLFFVSFARARWAHFLSCSDSHATFTSCKHQRQYEGNIWSWVPVQDQNLVFNTRWYQTTSENNLILSCKVIPYPYLRVHHLSPLFLVCVVILVIRPCRHSCRNGLEIWRIGEAEYKAPQVWWILLLLLLTNSARLCLQHSRNLGTTF